MSINHQGKQECIDNEVIKSASWFLDPGYSEQYDDALNASLVLMSCSIHLDGKKQIVNELDENEEPRIIKLIINRLQNKNENDDMRKNLKHALVNVSELPLGFLRICHDLSDKVETLDELFGPRSVKGLHELLPKLSQYKDPPEIRGDTELESNLENFRKYMKAMARIFDKYKEDAANVASNETINFTEKIAPFINPDLMLQKEAFTCLNEMRIDHYNCHVLNKFLQYYGNQHLKTQRFPTGVTSIMEEIQRENPNLIAIVMEASESILT